MPTSIPGRPDLRWPTTDLTYALPVAQALAETAVGVTLADVRDPELPLVYVNEAFTRLTGYTSDDALGRNCRFLQGPGTEPAAVQRIRDASPGCARRA